MSAHAADNSLKLLKVESVTTLRKIQQALETYLEDPDELEALESIIGLSNQIRGVFAILEQSDAAAFMAEMKLLVQTLKEGTTKDPEEAREVLSEAVIQAPRYLDWLEREGRKPQFNLQPLTARLRVARNGSANDQHSHTPPASGPSRGDPKALATKLRPTVQRALVAVVKGKINREGIQQIGKLFGHLKAVMGDEPLYRFWWLAEAYFIEVAGGGIRPTRQHISQLLRDLERQVQSLAETGHLDDHAAEVTKRLQGFLNASASGAKRVSSQEGYHPPQAEPVQVVQPEVSHGSGAGDMPSIDESTLAVIAGHLKESMSLIKDALDRFARDGSRDANLLHEQLERLHELANVLIMLNMDVASAVAVRMRGLFQSWGADSRQVNETNILSLASELILVEDSLESISELVYSEEMAAHVAAELDDHGKLTLLNDFHHRRARTIVIRELMDAVVRAKDFTAAHLDSQDGGADWSDILAVVRRFGGSLLMLGNDDLAQIAWRLERVILSMVEEQSIADTSAFINALAEVLLGLENGLQVLSREHRLEPAAIAEIQSQLKLLESLFKPPLAEWVPKQIQPVEGHVPTQRPSGIELAAVEVIPDIPPSPEELVVEPVPLVDEVAPEEPVVEPVPSVDEVVPEEPVAEPVPSVDEVVPEEPVAEPVPPTEEVVSEPLAVSPEDDEIIELPEIDPEFLEIFFEEAQGELDSINEQVLVLQENLVDQAALSSIRRSFHTLKGSGRMVGLASHSRPLNMPWK